MKLLCLLTTNLILYSFLAAQPFYPLHPSVGDTIDKLEKLDYSLFSRVDNQSYKYGLIGFENENYILHVTKLNGDSSYILSKEEIIEHQQNIEKLNNYYKDLASRKKLESKYPEKPSGKAPVLFNDKVSDQIRKEARMHIRLKEDAKRRQEFEQGLRGNGVQIEFF